MVNRYKLCAMFHSLARKARQLAADPVLRSWLRRRALGLTPAEPAFTPHHPPYLGADWRGVPPEVPSAVFAPLPEGAPTGEVTLALAGETVILRPGDEDSLFTRDFADIETMLSLHRFAWVPLLDASADPRWVGALWRAWAKRFAAPDHNWAWHPYTAAERAINLLTTFRRRGIPAPAEETLAVLAAHAPIIAQRLEWFGDHHTSNHCANNGRGLALLGLGLGLPKAADAGLRIMVAEGNRLFRPSGVLREGSSHYHLLMARQWASVWLAARAADRPETAALEKVLVAALAVLPHLLLDGHLPLVGDVSPDCPPGHLGGLLPGGDAMAGWTGLLPPEDRAALVALRDGVSPVARDCLAADGWLSDRFGPWTGLWHAEPEGWSPMPGHGHQDCGAAELHFDGVPVFVDPGRGSYEDAGEADAMVRGESHGGVTIDGIDPYPPNRPYYAPQFRAAFAGPARLARNEDGVTLSHHGFLRRFGLEAERQWLFAPRRLDIIDRFTRHPGGHIVTRRLVTPLAVVEIERAAIVLQAPSGRRFRVSAEGAVPVVGPIPIWHAYGESRPGSVVTFTIPVVMPIECRLIIQVV